VDTQKRVKLPDKFLPMLGGERSFILSFLIGEEKGLQIHTESNYKNYKENLDRLAESDDSEISSAYYEYSRIVSISETRIELDSQGRFLIPTQLYRHLGIESEVIFVPREAYKKIEIYCEETLQSILDSGKKLKVNPSLINKF
jgi:DNA-binding transcriptional regulator/RsmH inhibitor MraZ